MRSWRCGVPVAGSVRMRSQTSAPPASLRATDAGTGPAPSRSPGASDSPSSVCTGTVSRTSTPPDSCSVSPPVSRSIAASNRNTPSADSVAGAARPQRLGGDRGVGGGQVLGRPVQREPAHRVRAGLELHTSRRPAWSRDVSAPRRGRARRSAAARGGPARPHSTARPSTSARRRPPRPPRRHSIGSPGSVAGPAAG